MKMKLDLAGLDAEASDDEMEDDGGGLENEDTGGEVEADRSSLEVEVEGPGEKAVTSAVLEVVEACDCEEAEGGVPPAWGPWGDP